MNVLTQELFEANYNFAKAKTAYVFKTIMDPFIGKYSLFKVMSGVIKSDDNLYDQVKGQEIRISKLYVMKGSKAEEVEERTRAMWVPSARCRACRPPRHFRPRQRRFFIRRPQFPRHIVQCAILRQMPRRMTN